MALNVGLGPLLAIIIPLGVLALFAMLALVVVVFKTLHFVSRYNRNYPMLKSDIRKTELAGHAASQTASPHGNLVGDFWEKQRPRRSAWRSLFCCFEPDMSPPVDNRPPRISLSIGSGSRLSTLEAMYGNTAPDTSNATNNTNIKESHSSPEDAPKNVPSQHEGAPPQQPAAAAVRGTPAGPDTKVPAGGTRAGRRSPSNYNQTPISPPTPNTVNELAGIPPKESLTPLPLTVTSEGVVFKEIGALNFPKRSVDLSSDAGRGNRMSGTARETVSAPHETMPGATPRTPPRLSQSQSQGHGLAGLSSPLKFQPSSTPQMSPTRADSFTRPNFQRYPSGYSQRMSHGTAEEDPVYHLISRTRSNSSSETPAKVLFHPASENVARLNHGHFSTVSSVAGSVISSTHSDDSPMRGDTISGRRPALLSNLAPPTEESLVDIEKDRSSAHSSLQQTPVHKTTVPAHRDPSQREVASSPGTADTTSWYTPGKSPTAATSTPAIPDTPPYPDGGMGMHHPSDALNTYGRVGPAGMSGTIDKVQVNEPSSLQHMDQQKFASGPSHGPSGGSASISRAPSPTFASENFGNVEQRGNPGDFQSQQEYEEDTRLELVPVIPAAREGISEMGSGSLDESQSGGSDLPNSPWRTQANQSSSSSRGSSLSYMVRTPSPHNEPVARASLANLRRGSSDAHPPDSFPTPAENVSGQHTHAYASSRSVPSAGGGESRRGSLSSYQTAVQPSTPVRTRYDIAPSAKAQSISSSGGTDASVSQRRLSPPSSLRSRRGGLGSRVSKSSLHSQRGNHRQSQRLSEVPESLSASPSTAGLTRSSVFSRISKGQRGKRYSKVTLNKPLPAPPPKGAPETAGARSPVGAKYPEEARMPVSPGVPPPARTPAGTPTQTRSAEARAAIEDRTITEARTAPEARAHEARIALSPASPLMATAENPNRVSTQPSTQGSTNTSTQMSDAGNGVIANFGGRILRAQHAYDPVLPDELNLEVGDTVRVYQLFDDRWCSAWLVTNEDRGRRHGICPIAVLVEPAEFRSHSSMMS